MKSILIIGMGKFGHHLCSNLAKLENEIMIVDEKEEMLEDLLPIVTSAKIGDCTNEEVLRSLGIRNFDICFVCIGTNFQSSLEITSLIKEVGAKYVISKANRDIHAKFLLRNGADEVIYPDRDIAEKLAVRVSANHVFDYIVLRCIICRFIGIPIMRSWTGKSIGEVDIRAKYHVNVLGMKKDGKLDLLPDANYVMREDEHIMVLGRKEDIDKILKHIS